MIQDILQQIKPLDFDIMRQARELQANLIKPIGSLGKLEEISIRFAGITGKVNNTALRKIIYLFGADNGIYEEGVCSSPQYLTGELMNAYATKQNAGINILARQAGAELKLYDLGIKNFGPRDNVITCKFLPEGTNNFLKERAMSYELAEKVIEFGINLVHDAKSNGVNVIGTGEVGMANTTTACACIMAALRSRNENLVGRGAGLDDEAFTRKKSVIIKALDFHKDSFTDPINILSCVGGLDIAAMTGVFIGGAVYRVPIIIDGVISIAAALLAYQLEPLTREYMFASHESAEPAYNYAANEMNLTPALKLSMRLGEGTGCAIFMQIIDSALAIINNMGTFDEL